MIPVLFARKNSIYKQLGCDVWDKGRDARNWKGGAPGIYHPPCGQWGNMAQFANVSEEKQLAIQAVNLIRQYGGVLEHPATSKLWNYMGLPMPGQIDQYGGYSICINQSWFGHKAEKRTLLYIVGVDQQNLPEIPISFDRIDYCVRYSRRQWKLRKEKGIKSVKEITKQEREHTPEALAKWLMAVAEKCVQPGTMGKFYRTLEGK